MENEKNIQIKGILSAVFGGVCWGLSGCCGQYLFTNNAAIDAKWLTTVRMISSGIIMLAICLLKYRQKLKELLRSKKDFGRVMLFALFGLILCQLTYLCAIQYTNAATATVIQYTGPVLIMVVVCVTARRLPKFKELLALFLAVGGTFLITTHGNPNTLFISKVGLIWCILAAVSMVFYAMILGDTTSRFPIIVCNGVGMIIGGIGLALALRVWNYQVPLTRNDCIAIAFIVIVGTICAFGLYLNGVKLIGPSKASVLASTEPLTAAVVSHFWLGTQFTAADIIGFACVLSTILVLAKKE